MLRYSHAGQSSRRDGILILCAFALLYIGLSWLVSGGDTWWILDLINGTNVFYGDDAYRFFLARSAWTHYSIYTYNFVMPVSLALDGIVTTISNNNLFLSRSVHGVLGAAAIFLVWDSGRALALNRLVMIFACLIMGLIPRYAFTTLSFYGEFWLGFFICLITWLLLRRHFFWLSLVAGLLPLLRPEGIYFYSFIFLFLVLERKWKEALCSVVPGLLYLIFLITTLHQLSDYMHWREELKNILVKIPFNYSRWEILNTYTFVLLIPAVAGAFLKQTRAFWPVTLAAITWVVVLQGLVLLGLAKFEERYIYSIAPVLILLWASCISWVSAKVYEVLDSRFFVNSGVAIIAVAAIFQGLGQLTLLDIKIKEYGYGGVAVKAIKGQWGDLFIHHDLSAMNSREAIVDRISYVLALDKGIDRLIVQDPFLYYKLDPLALPGNVVVGFPATTYMIFQLLMNGQIFIQHSSGRHYDFIRFGEPDFGLAEKRALYVDLMPIEGYPFTWKYDALFYELYLFSYSASADSEVDLSGVPALKNIDIDMAWKEWLSRRQMK